MRSADAMGSASCAGRGLPAQPAADSTDTQTAPVSRARRLVGRT
jgi:hypothetical protein